MPTIFTIIPDNVKITNSCPTAKLFSNKQARGAEEYNPADTTMPLLGTGLSHNFGRGNKLFELSNHLGNVLVTLNDKKLGVSSNNSTVDYFKVAIDMGLMVRRMIMR